MHLLQFKCTLGLFVQSHRASEQLTARLALQAMYGAQEGFWSHDLFFFFSFKPNISRKALPTQIA